ncbi:mechanosensitive ion channel family protein [Sphingosinicella sp. LY1275]|uniref:mechanosensitive ion channel family protein n=1 Tax=Sphingosinicella sp. LY1275 TaxID=3095379 RepID=UPI002ADEB9B2|nr:mechanosensitive ion channel family protein [Sphingosinicella sp. LY1275]MEA1014892.1 mechanosensitive ion channel family protein [Sphingosinicella sp. LY1275]
MSNANNGSVIDAAENLSEKSVEIATQTSGWISTNGLDILIAAGLGAVIALVLLGVRALACRLMASGAAGDTHWRIIFARVLSRTNLFFIIMCSAELVAEHAATPLALLRVINVLFVIAAALQAAIWARELILGFIQHRVGVAEEHSTLGSAIGIIRLLVSVAVFAIAIILILDNLGVNVTGLVAGLGIGGIAIGLAAQGIFSDLFAALSIIFDKPFRKGDGIKVGQINGSVEQIGLKTTRIRSLSGEEVVVSNAKLLEQQLHNYTNLEHRRMVQMFGVTYQTPPEVMDGIPELVRGIVEGHDHATMVRCGLIGFGASSLDFELQFDIHSLDYEYVFMTRHAIFIEMLKAFAAQGIEFAYPTQVSFTAAPDGELIMPYPHVKMLATEDCDN